MCFSATASFAGGAALALIGTASLYRNPEPSRRLFAAMPLVFGLQQISEGLVWTGLQMDGGSGLAKTAAYIFLFAALIIWPSFIPISVLLQEPPGRRRQQIKALAVIGVTVSACYGLGLLLFDMTASINQYHIHYFVAAPRPYVLILYVAYLLVTILPLFISANHRLGLLGVVVALSYLAAFIFYREYLISVWCFFAAICSVIVWWIVGSKAKTPVAADAGR